MSSIDEHRPGRALNPRGEGAKLRGEILEAVTSLLDDGPAEAITLRSVAKRAGVSAPAIYRHFANLDLIMLTVVEAALDDLSAALRAARSDSHDARAQLSAICAAYLRFATEHPQRYRLVFGGAWDASAAAGLDAGAEPRLRELGQDALSVLQDAITACVASGESTSDDAAADAVALWIALHGLAELRRTTPLFLWPARTEQRLITDLARLTAL